MGPFPPRLQLSFLRLFLPPFLGVLPALLLPWFLLLLGRLLFCLLCLVQAFLPRELLCRARGLTVLLLPLGLQLHFLGQLVLPMLCPRFLVVPPRLQCLCLRSLQLPPHVLPCCLWALNPLGLLPLRLWIGLLAGERSVSLGCLPGFSTYPFSSANLVPRRRSVVLPVWMPFLLSFVGIAN